MSKKQKIFVISASVLTFLVVTFLILAFSLGWFVKADDGNGTADDGDSSRGDVATSWEEECDDLNGRYTKTFEAGGTEKTLIIEFNTEAGEMDVMVYDKESEYPFVIDDSQVYYKNVGNLSLEVPFSKDAVVRLDARDFDGRFSIIVK